jgi:sphingomyelin phosphodiesterase
LIHNPKDQDGQLQWLADILLQAEKDEEKVHILGHIPSGDTECLKTWSREFHKIIDRLVMYNVTSVIRNKTEKSVLVLETP